MNKCLAAFVSISLILSAPGAQAWGQVATTIRPVSLGSSFLGTAGSITPTFSPLATPALALSAPSLSISNLAPVPAAPAVAVLPTAVAVAAVLTAASARLATVPETNGKNEGTLNQLSALFDGLNTMSAPSAPEAPTPEAAPALRPAHEPFIPATRVIADMEKLLKADPAAALKVAAATIVDIKERRSEVKIGAQRILDVLPLEKTLPHYLDLLKITADPAIQAAKAAGTDSWWYLQRTALKRIARDASTLTSGAPETIVWLQASYKDRNAAVRLAAASALTAFGVDPGAEPSYADVAVVPATVISYKPLKPAPRPTIKEDVQMFKTLYKTSAFVRWSLPVTATLLIAFTGWLFLANPFDDRYIPPAPTAITQTIAAPAEVTKPAPVESVKADPKNAAAEQMAKDSQRTADAAERIAKVAEDLAKPKAAPSMMSNLFWSFGPMILIFAVGTWLMRKFMNRQNGGGGGGPAGVNNKPKMNMEKPKTRFADVAGIDESLVEVQEIVDFLRDPARFKLLGARMPKGVLMEGPPGTGKTLLARALAGETNASFISISGSDFVEMYVGLGARRVRELFETARKNVTKDAPVIIFIDEIDAVGKKRGGGGAGTGGDLEHDQTINALLKEMDGFDNSDGILVIAATNRADVLDPALIRPGRFDRTIHVGLPQALGREAILALHAKKARLAVEVDLTLIARRTTGLSGAFLENVINEAALLAARRGGESISATDIDEAVDRATIGGKRTLRLSEPLKRRIAAHEAGHVLANLLNEIPELRVPVNKVTILPHGSGALGFAETGSQDGDTYLHTQDQLEARLDTALGGLVAEKILYGKWSTGPGSDLEAATRVARAMVQQLGMSEEMGLAQTAPNQYGQSAFGGEADSRALLEVNKLLKASMIRTEARLRAGAEKHKAMIEALMLKETLSADDIDAIAHPTRQ
jgi:cell division protease FtsH